MGIEYNTDGGNPMKNNVYKPRIIDAKVEQFLQAFGAVCIEGPKWCGKTWTSAYHSQSAVYLADPAGNFQNRRLAEMDPSLILPGDTPRLLDEWQEVPALWDAVRFQVDERAKKGQFILTGSATPQHKGILHSGAGRIARLRMHPMSLFESGKSSGQVSLKALCEGKLQPAATGDITLEMLIDAILRGGWPANQEGTLEQAVLLPKAYLQAVLEDDIYRIDDVKRDKRKMELLLRSLARNESTTVTNRKLKNDIKEKDAEDIDEGTVAAYLEVFSRLFLLDNQKPFDGHIRSSVRVKQAEKRHLADPSLACALLGTGKEALMGDLETLGFMFEALCERDLKIYAESFDAQLYHYQDYQNREIDAVIAMPNGHWNAIEIKLGANQIENAATSLLKLKREFQEDPKGVPPDQLIVLCGLSKAAYQRQDGIYVVPLTALKP